MAMTNNTEQQESMDVAAILEYAACEISDAVSIASRQVYELNKLAERIRSMPKTFTSFSLLLFGEDVECYLKREVDSYISSLSTLKPISTKERPPTAEDGAYVLAWNIFKSTSTNWDKVIARKVIEEPNSWPFWLPLSALPVPGSDI